MVNKISPSRGKSSNQEDKIQVKPSLEPKVKKPKEKKIKKEKIKLTSKEVEQPVAVDAEIVPKYAIPGSDSKKTIKPSRLRNENVSASTLTGSKPKEMTEIIVKKTPRKITVETPVKAVNKATVEIPNKKISHNIVSADATTSGKIKSSKEKPAKVKKIKPEKDTPRKTSGKIKPKEVEIVKLSEVSKSKATPVFKPVVVESSNRIKPSATRTKISPVKVKTEKVEVGQEKIKKKSIDTVSKVNKIAQKSKLDKPGAIDPKQKGDQAKVVPVKSKVTSKSKPVPKTTKPISSNKQVSTESPSKSKSKDKSKGKLFVSKMKVNNTQRKNPQEVYHKTTDLEKAMAIEKKKDGNKIPVNTASNVHIKVNKNKALNKYERSMKFNLHIMIIIYVLIVLSNLFLPLYPDSKSSFSLYQIAIILVHGLGLLGSYGYLQQYNPFIIIAIIRFVQILLRQVFFSGGFQWGFFLIVLALDLLLIFVEFIDKSQYEYVMEG